MIGFLALPVLTSAALLAIGFMLNARGSRPDRGSNSRFWFIGAAVVSVLLSFGILFAL